MGEPTCSFYGITTKKMLLMCINSHDHKWLYSFIFVVDVLKRNVSVETVQNRAARALGNLAMDPEGSAEVHSAGLSQSLICLK